MSIMQIVVLGLIFAGFAIFALVLAWGEHQTRNVARDRPAKPQLAPATNIEALQAIALASSAQEQKAQAN